MAGRASRAAAKPRSARRSRSSCRRRSKRPRSARLSCDMQGRANAAHASSFGSESVQGATDQDIHEARIDTQVADLDQVELGELAAQPDELARDSLRQQTRVQKERQN